MIVSGLRRAPSAIAAGAGPPTSACRRRRGSATACPGNAPSGIGPLWQSRQRPTLRLATIARPRAASPGRDVIGAGMAIAHHDVVARSVLRPGDRDGQSRKGGRAGPLVTSLQPKVSAVIRPEPAVGVERLLGAEATDDLDWADAAGAGNVSQHPLVGPDRRRRSRCRSRAPPAVAGVDHDRIDRPCDRPAARRWLPRKPWPGRWRRTPTWACRP